MRRFLVFLVIALIIGGFGLTIRGLTLPDPSLASLLPPCQKQGGQTIVSSSSGCISGRDPAAAADRLSEWAALVYPRRINFEVGEGLLAAAFLFLALMLIPSRPKIKSTALAYLGGGFALAASFVLLVLHMAWYCHDLHWGGSWACKNVFNYNQLDWFVMPMRSVVSIPLTAAVSFALATTLFALRFGLRKTIKWFVVPFLFVYTFFLSLYDPVEMSIQLTSYLAVSYHDIPLLSNRFFQSMSGVAMALILVESWSVRRGIGGRKEAATSTR